MNHRKATYLAWVLCALSVVSPLAQAIFRLLKSTASPSLFDLVETFGWGLALPVVFSVVAALIISRRPGNRVGWLMMLPALTIAASPAETILQNMSGPPAAFTPGLWLLVWMNGWSWIPIIFPVMLIPLHFPTGRPPSPRWRWVNWLAIGMWLFFIVFVAFAETIGPLNGQWTAPNPIGFLPIDDLFEGAIGLLWGAGLAVIVSSSLASLVVRYRRAHYAERQQIKWLVYAAAGFAIYYVLSIWIEDDLRVAGWRNLLFVSSILGIPLAIAIAILRYRLYDIDLIIRRTLVYTALSGSLALVYFGSVLLLQTVFGRLAGEQAPIIIVMSTLLIAALFAPLRRRIQDVINRRFYRQKYDAQQVLAQFAQTARDEVSLEALTAEMMRAVETTMRPEQVSIWIREERWRAPGSAWSRNAVRNEWETSTR